MSSRSGIQAQYKEPKKGEFWKNPSTQTVKRKRKRTVIASQHEKEPTGNLLFTFVLD